MYRQGDVLIIPLEGPLPADLKPVPLEAGRIVLAHGEATGHAHAIKSRNAGFFQEAAAVNPRRFLHVVGGSVALKHEEHAPVELKPGAYEVRRQREYTPEEIRNVAD